MERYFSLSNERLRIPCRIYEPDFGAPRRCILGVHGFGASKDAEILTTLSEGMSFFGAATVCFDFPAHGDNPMQSDTLTLDNCIETLLYTAQWAHNRYPDLDFCIFASGFGAYITLIAIDQLEEVSGSAPDLIVCSWGVRRALLKYFKENGVRMDSMEIEGGFKALSFNGIPVVADRFCPPKSMYFFNTNDIKMYQLGDWQWLEDDNGRILHQVPGKPVYTATLVKYAELMFERPNSIARITDIDEV